MSSTSTYSCIAQSDLGVVGLSRYAPGEVMPEHAHPGAAISVVLAGGLEERVGRREVEVGPFSVVTKPADVAHANRFGQDGARMLSVDLTADALEGLEGWREGGDGWCWHHAPEGVTPAVRLGLDALVGVPDETAVADAISALVEAGGSDRRSPPPWLSRLRDRLHDEWDEAPSVAELAEEAGVHRVYLARRFRQHLGTTVTGYLRSLRVQAAARALLTDAPLVHVALDTGFADQPHFSRTFRRSTGFTPGDYRARLRAA